ncbi:MAG: hypothetical protein A2W82_00745 [Sulfurimonas sp. RIFCSPLOWO2_12_36_12]|uniref:AbrB/MazE/SpoVT family DNA-binding domain-containing protein n=1 Tax=Sulfurimonas sp. RIFCSPLOWO2_12_36_12 TaxID=1802253 RepID=UPI0008C92221|nr:hypothetical protein [Sulfurimonas sp. RIFCSPLOWO2_12_36_12]OHE01191.1 MAG: hypothetical protein A2W82_00745 [Sulfurimonas sp. RIFCSPLOWO2_12_36_12]
MQVSLIDIGTSKGIRIPSAILKTLDRPDKFDLRVENHRIILEALNNPRDGWEAKFKNAHNDLLIDDTIDLGQWDDL